MSWKNGSLHVGEGRTGHSVFIDYHGTPELGQISAIGHTTDGAGGEWDVPLREGISLTENINNIDKCQLLYISKNI